MNTISAAAAISPIDSIFSIFNGNPYFIGIMMLILNLGGRFIAMEITKEQEKFFQNPYVRRFLIFTVLFVATRNIWVSFWSTVVIILFLGYLLNENSSLCLFKTDFAVDGASCSTVAGPGGIPGLTPEEQEILRRLREKEARYLTPVENDDNKPVNTVSIVEKYMNFMKNV
jgi:hypothetical protein